MLHKTMDKRDCASTGNTREQLHLDLPAECDDFDWDAGSTPSKNNISPIIFRPGQPESPLDLDFDHQRASLGKFSQIARLVARKDQHNWIYSILVLMRYTTLFFSKLHEYQVTTLTSCFYFTLCLCVFFLLLLLLLLLVFLLFL